MKRKIDVIIEQAQVRFERAIDGIFDRVLSNSKTIEALELKSAGDLQELVKEDVPYLSKNLVESI